MIVETGAGIPNANSYLSVAEATSILAGRGGNSQWVAAPDKERLLIEASSAIDWEYGGRWVGSRKTLTQGLDWPRVYSDGDPVPVEGEFPLSLRVAVAVMATRAIQGPLLCDRDTAGVTVKLGPVTKQVGPGKSSVQRPEIDSLVKSLVFKTMRIQR